MEPGYKSHEPPSRDILRPKPSHQNARVCARVFFARLPMVSQQTAPETRNQSATHAFIVREQAWRPEPLIASIHYGLPSRLCIPCRAPINSPFYPKSWLPLNTKPQTLNPNPQTRPPRTVAGRCPSTMPSTLNARKQEHNVPEEWRVVREQGW